MKLAATVEVVTPDPKHTEANTKLLGLKLVVNLLDTSCIIASDAKNLVHLIYNKDSVPSWRVAHVVFECRSLLKDNTRATLEFSIRSMNEATHCINCQCLNHQLFGQWLYESLLTPLLDELGITSCELYLI